MLGSAALIDPMRRTCSESGCVVYLAPAWRGLAASVQYLWLVLANERNGTTLQGPSEADSDLGPL